MMREAELRVKDKSYRATPIGQLVGRYLRECRWAGAPESSIDQRERVLARFSIRHSDYEDLAEFASAIGTEYALAFLDTYWGDAADPTKAQKLSILKTFLEWAKNKRLLEYNPLAGVKAPRQRRTERSAYPRDLILRLISAQESLRDQCCLQLLARMGLRKNELRVLQIRDIDLARNLLTVHGKGGHVAVMPIEFEQLRKDLYLETQSRGKGSGDEFLLYPKRSRTRPMSESGVHLWFKRCLERAGLPERVMIHEMRHTAADDLWRTTGNLILAQQLLRHAHSSTTERYLHPDREDLRAAMREVDADWGN